MTDSPYDLSARARQMHRAARIAALPTLTLPELPRFTTPRLQPAEGLTIALDMDEVLCEMVRGLLTAYTAKTGHVVDFEAMVDYDLRKHLTQMANPWDALTEEMYLQCAAVPGAIEGVRLIRDRGMKTIVVTASWMHGTWIRAKFAWLKQRGFGDYEKGEVICTPVKTVVDYDVIIDDKPAHVIDAIAAGRGAILFDRPWNRNLDERTRMRLDAERAGVPFFATSDWAAIPDILESWQTVWGGRR